MPTTSELAEILLETAPEHEGWSLVESSNAEGGYEDLLEWAREMTLSAWNMDFTVRRPQLGLVLLWLESEVVRRRGGEGTIWPILSDQQIVPWNTWVHSELFHGSGCATNKHRKLLEETARHFALRHTFGQEEGMHWFRLIYLQFGFTHDDAVKRLAGWLSGTAIHLPISVQRLLGGKDSGAKSFQNLWYSLRAFRLGNLSQALTESRMRESPWVLSEWCVDLICAAKKSKAQALDSGGKEASEVSFFTAPQLTWDLRHRPVFTTNLCNLQDRALDSSEYHFKTGDTILARLIKQADGSYHSDAGERIVLPAKPAVPLSLVEPVSGEIAAHDEVVLWDLQVEVSLYSAKSGLRLLPGENPKKGVELFLAASADVEIDPAPDTVVELPLGYRLHHLAKGWAGEISATLDGESIWSATMAAVNEADINGSAVLVRADTELDLRKDQWREGPPWKIEVSFKAPKDWTITTIRQRRTGEGGVDWVNLSGRLDSFEGLEWTEGGVASNRVKKSVAVTEIDCLKHLLFRVGIQSGGKRRTELVKTTVPCVGVFKWDEFGIPERNAFGNNLLLGDARRHTWSFALPKQTGEEEELKELQLREGNQIVGRVRSRPVRIPNLGGYGAPLRIFENPYQSQEVVMEVSPCVLDGGVLGPLTWAAEQDGFMIRSNYTDLGEDHRLLAWRSCEAGNVSVSDIPREILLAQDGGWLWQTDNQQPVHAVALFFRGTRLGSWFHHHTWSRAAIESRGANPGEIAAMISAWKAPILKADGDHFQTMAIWLSENLAAVLPVWLGKSAMPGPDGSLWPLPGLDLSWLSAVGDLLLDVLPDPDADEVGELVEALAPDHKGIEALNTALFALLEVCPILAARVVKCYLSEFATTEQSQLFRAQIPYVLANELDAIDRNQIGDNAGLDHEKHADKIAKRLEQLDGFWLRTTVPSFGSIPVLGSVVLSQAYRTLSKRRDYKLYCLSRWWNEL